MFKFPQGHFEKFIQKKEDTRSVMSVTMHCVECEVCNK